MVTIVPSRRNFFYKRLVISSTIFTNEHDIDFGFQATSVIITNDSTTDSIGFSFRKPYLDGELFCNDGPLVMDGLSEGKLWLKKISINDVQVRVWAWGI